MRHAAQRKSSNTPRVVMAMTWYEPDHCVGAMRYAREAGWVLQICWPGAEAALEQPGLAGVISQLTHYNKAFARRVQRIKAPRVELCRALPQPGIPHVLVNRRRIGELAARHLLERNFRNLVYIGRAADAKDSDSSLSGFNEAARQAGCPVAIVSNEPARESTEEPLRNVLVEATRKSKSTDVVERVMAELAAFPKPLAVFCPDLMDSIRLQDACLDAGYLVPEQIAFVTVCDSPTEGTLARVPLTNINADYVSQGYEAARLLDQLIRKRGATRNATVTVPPQGLTVQASSDTWAIQDLPTARAMRFIMQNLHDPGLSVPQICRAACLSRRQLYRQFRQHMGRSIAAEVSRLRIDRVKPLLRETTLPLHALAEQCGFAGALHLRRALVREAGLTPSAFRKANP